MKNLSSFASDFNHPINYCFQILENTSLAICFLSCFSVNTCRSNRARGSASSSRELATLKSRVPNISMAAMFTAS